MKTKCIYFTKIRQQSTPNVQFLLIYNGYHFFFTAFFFPLSYEFKTASVSGALECVAIDLDIIVFLSHIIMYFCVPLIQREIYYVWRDVCMWLNTSQCS